MIISEYSEMIGRTNIHQNLPMPANKFSFEIMQNTRRSVTCGNDNEEEEASHELAPLLLKLAARGGDDSLGIAPI
jgi:hypothetical protein